MSDDYELAKLIVSGATGIFAIAGGTVTVVNFLRTTRWKRAELANEYLEDLTSNAELVFASRALDWGGGRLVVPEMLRPILDDGHGAPVDRIEHDPEVMEAAMVAGLLTDAVRADPRLQVYRTALDSLLSWLSLIRQALDRRLFAPADVEALRYWLRKIGDADWLHGFIRDFGYARDMRALARHFDEPVLGAAFARDAAA
ncbi:hypothetical protein [Paracraurococcus lichenis]|uniref:Uncharacterized protein n=1 Tax=Paracraurococcus lichenis TaxID=3064888 RepID=A0ABT9DVP0_9PROT|nr:hypothetical protein [Paracraurococcus sp. LOR1-02]MDO9707967.1 hypothetical protein [Paracraurococcus sp. LOR1-02]